MNKTAATIYDATDRLAAGADPGRVAYGVKSALQREVNKGQIDLKHDEAVAWLDAASKFCRAYEMLGWAEELADAAVELKQGGVVPSRWFYAWANEIPTFPPSPTSPPSKDAKAVAPQQVDINVNLSEQVAITSMPVRKTTSKVTRDKHGLIAESVQIQEDVE